MPPIPLYYGTERITLLGAPATGKTRIVDKLDGMANKGTISHVLKTTILYDDFKKLLQEQERPDLLEEPLKQFSELTREIIKPTCSIRRLYHFITSEGREHITENVKLTAKREYETLLSLLKGYEMNSEEGITKERVTKEISKIKNRLYNQMRNLSDILRQTRIEDIADEPPKEERAFADSSEFIKIRERNKKFMDSAANDFNNAIGMFMDQYETYLKTEKEIEKISGDIGKLKENIKKSAEEEIYAQVKQTILAKLSNKEMENIAVDRLYQNLNKEDLDEIKQTINPQLLENIDKQIVLGEEKKVKLRKISSELTKGDSLTQFTGFYNQLLSYELQEGRRLKRQFIILQDNEKHLESKRREIIYNYKMELSKALTKDTEEISKALSKHKTQQSKLESVLQRGGLCYTAEQISDDFIIRNYGEEIEKEIDYEKIRLLKEKSQETIINDECKPEDKLNAKTIRTAIIKCDYSTELTEKVNTASILSEELIEKIEEWDTEYFKKDISIFENIEEHIETIKTRTAAIEQFKKLRGKSKELLEQYDPQLFENNNSNNENERLHIALEELGSKYSKQENASTRLLLNSFNELGLNAKNIKDVIEKLQDRINKTEDETEELNSSTELIDHVINVISTYYPNLKNETPGEMIAKLKEFDATIDLINEYNSILKRRQTFSLEQYKKECAGTLDELLNKNTPVSLQEIEELYKLKLPALNSIITDYNNKISQKEELTNTLKDKPKLKLETVLNKIKKHPEDIILTSTKGVTMSDTLSLHIDSPSLNDNLRYRLYAVQGQIPGIKKHLENLFKKPADFREPDELTDVDNAQLPKHINQLGYNIPILVTTAKPDEKKITKTKDLNILLKEHEIANDYINLLLRIRKEELVEGKRQGYGTGPVPEFIQKYLSKEGTAAPLTDLLSLTGTIKNYNEDLLIVVNKKDIGKEENGATLHGINPDYLINGELLKVSIGQEEKIIRTKDLPILQERHNNLKVIEEIKDKIIATSAIDGQGLNDIYAEIFNKHMKINYIDAHTKKILLDTIQSFEKRLKDMISVDDDKEWSIEKINEMINKRIDSTKALVDIMQLKEKIARGNVKQSLPEIHAFLATLEQKVGMPE